MIKCIDLHAESLENQISLRRSQKVFYDFSKSFISTKLSRSDFEAYVFVNRKSISNDFFFPILAKHTKMFSVSQLYCMTRMFSMISGSLVFWIKVFVCFQIDPKSNDKKQWKIKKKALSFKAHKFLQNNSWFRGKWSFLFFHSFRTKIIVHLKAH